MNSSCGKRSFKHTATYYRKVKFYMQNMSRVKTLPTSSTTIVSSLSNISARPLLSPQDCSFSPSSQCSLKTTQPFLHQSQNPSTSTTPQTLIEVDTNFDFSNDYNEENYYNSIYNEFNDIDDVNEHGILEKKKNCPLHKDCRIGQFAIKLNILQ